MPEGMSIEVAHHLSEHEGKSEPDEHRPRLHRVLEIIEVALLAVVAIATAWSGYQAARFDGKQSLQYGESSRLRFEADAASTRGGQELAADSAGFNTWQQAQADGQTALMGRIERRFTPDYRAAFDAWLQTDPLNDPTAPPGPGYMPGFSNPNMDKAAELNAEASSLFDEGTEARETGEKYVRDTVLFASVLFLVAMAQRQRSHGARVATNTIALGLLAFVMFSILTLPRG